MDCAEAKILALVALFQLPLSTTVVALVYVSFCWMLRGTGDSLVYGLMSLTRTLKD